MSYGRFLAGGAGAYDMVGQDAELVVTRVESGAFLFFFFYD
jgi:hypothetical protein